MSRSKQKGTKFETAVVRYLNDVDGFPEVERRALAGIADKGDIAGVPDWALEAKCVDKMALGQWAVEAAREAVAAGVDNWAVIHSRKYKPVEESYVTIPLRCAHVLLGAPVFPGVTDQPKFRDQVAAYMGPLWDGATVDSQDATGTLGGWAVDIRCHTGLTLQLWVKAVADRAGDRPWAVIHSRRLVPISEVYFTTNLQHWATHVSRSLAQVTTLAS